MKMKKGLALLLAACSCFAFAACEEDAPQEPEHEHAYATEWTKDETDHWHVCEGEDCTEIADKATHEWNAGEITTEASASANGVKTFTCTVCAQTKTESVPYVVDTEVTAEEWANALKFSTQNCTITQNVEAPNGTQTNIRSFDGDKFSVDDTFVGSSSESSSKWYYSIEGGKYYCYSYDQETSAWEKTEIDQDSYSSTKTGYDLDETFLFANATYDENTKAYIVQDVVMGNSTFTDISVKFEEGRFVSLTLTQVMGAQSATMELSAVYGDVNITLPTVTTLPPVVVDTEVTAEEWLAALSFTGVDNYEIVAASGGVEQTIRFDGTRVMTFGVNPSGGEIEQYYEKDGTNYYVYLVDAGVTQKEETTESSFFNAKTGGVAETFLASDFTYDAATKTYKAEEIVLFDGMVKYTDAEIKFENKKLVSMRYTYSFDNATPTAGTLDVTYGGVQTIEIPQV